jgi:hypothetical protein
VGLHFTRLSKFPLQASIPGAPLPLQSVGPTIFVCFPFLWSPPLPLLRDLLSTTTKMREQGCHPPALRNGGATGDARLPRGLVRVVALPRHLRASRREQSIFSTAASSGFVLALLALVWRGALVPVVSLSSPMRLMMRDKYNSKKRLL